MKTKKLKCIVTGKVLNASLDYYQKKLEKAGSIEELNRTYVCKEAKDLLEKGLSVDQVRVRLEAPDNLPPVPEDIILTLTTNEYGLKKNTLFTELTAFTHQETDPEVADFINNIR